MFLLPLERDLLPLERERGRSLLFIELFRCDLSSRESDLYRLLLLLCCLLFEDLSLDSDKVELLLRERTLTQDLVGLFDAERGRSLPFNRDLSRACSRLAFRFCRASLPTGDCDFLTLLNDELSRGGLI